MQLIIHGIVVLSLITSALVAEQSVYGSSSGFYGSEKTISANKKNIRFLQQKISQQNERINGLMSIVEGLTATVNELRNKSSIANNVQAKNTDTVLLQELGQMIDKINAEYVTKGELKKALLTTVGVENKKIDISKKITSTKISLDNLSTKTLYSEGVRLFVKHHYSEARKRFNITDTKGYKPAASNYYLGEIAYYTKKYEDAIFYYKKSAGLYDKASYIDTLLLHTAISLERTGEKKQARVFYENIIENYAGKKTATIARDKLKSL